METIENLHLLYLSFAY